MSKLDENNRWQGKMLLTEHVAQYDELQHLKKRKKRPDLAEDSFVAIDTKLRQAISEGRIVTLTVYDEWEDQSITGRIVKLDRTTMRVKVDLGNEDVSLIPHRDILEVQDVD